METTVEALLGKWESFVPFSGLVFPHDWQSFEAGKVVQRLMAEKGWHNLNEVPTLDKRKLFEVFALVKAGDLVVKPPKTTDKLKVALVGDKFHGLHLVSIMVSKGLEGPEKMHFQDWYSSNEHFAEYLAELMSLPKPETKAGLRDAGTEFEYRYATEKGFARTYLCKQFGSAFACVASDTVSDLSQLW